MELLGVLLFDIGVGIVCCWENWKLFSLVKVGGGGVGNWGGNG